MKTKLKFYTEFNPDLDYSREKLRWNAWGSIEEDFHAKKYMPEILEFVRHELSIENDVFTPSAPMEEISIPTSKFTPQDKKSLSSIVGEKNYFDSKMERIMHSAGRSYYDVVRLHFNRLKSFVDGVVYPGDEKSLRKVLDFCNKNKITIIPFGGGSSVVGSLEVIPAKSSKKILSIDLTKLKSLIQIHDENLTATFQAGIYGPHLEKILNEEGYTLGHFPQSFVYSTLGGWVAARSAGQQSNKYGKIEEMISSIKMMTLSGEIKTGDYPASAAGPDWNHIIAGSEGLLGIITEVTVKIHELPETRMYAGYLFPSFHEGKEFIREVNQSGIETSMLRLSDEEETRLFGTLGTLGKKGIFHSLKSKLEDFVLSFYKLNKVRAALIFGLDGDEEEVYRNSMSIREIASRHKGFYVGEKMGRNWIKNRFNMPFLRNHVMEYGVAVDTMETSATYDKLESIREDFHKKVKEEFPDSVSLCHISHSYQNGACLYFTVLFKMDSKKPVEQWKKLKKLASDTFLSHGASASHHHGIGADHKHWYEKELSKDGLAGLRAMKDSLDKNGILNPKKVFHD